jgi:transposase-like protein
MEVCPHCDSLNVAIKDEFPSMGKVIVRYHCYDCSRNWKDLQDANAE